MKIVRNAVFAVKRQREKKFTTFLYVNSYGNISPFWREKQFYHDGWSRHGELSDAGCCRMHPQDTDHNHWRGVEAEGYDIVMIQSHVTNASDVDLRAAAKIADRTNS